MSLLTVLAGTTGWAWTNDFRSMTPATTAAGNTEFYQGNDLKYTATGGSDLPDTVAGANVITVAANRVWFAKDINGVQFMCSRGYTGVQAASATASSAAGTLTILRATTYKTVGTAIDPQNHCAYFAIANSVRGCDVDGNAGSDDSCLYMIQGLNGNFGVWLDYAGRIKVTSTGTNGSGGGTSSLYVHAGINQLMVRVVAGVVTLFLDNGAGTATVDTSITAVGNTGARNIINYFDSNVGSQKFFGRAYTMSFFSTGAATNGNIASIFAAGVPELVTSAKTKFVGFIGDSESQGFYGRMGYSVPSAIAEMEPTWFCYSTAHSGASIATLAHGGQPAVTGGTFIDHQLPQMQTAVTAWRTAGNTGLVDVVVYGGKNDCVGYVNGSQTLANTFADLDSLYGSLKQIANRTIGVVPSPVAKAVDNDTNVATCEVFMRALQASIISRVGNLIYDAVDLKSLYNTQGGTSNNCRASVVYDRRRWTPNGNSLVAADGTTSGEGLHDGVVGQDQTTGMIHGAVSQAFNASQSTTQIVPIPRRVA